ncbi:1-aminocyclopropane-1-carboxylate oxidase homolog 1, partial [Linum perenne]
PRDFNLHFTSLHLPLSHHQQCLLPKDCIKEETKMEATATATKPSYDRLAQLKAFDETKAGVKGLSDAGITQLPPIFHIPSHLLDCRPTASSKHPNFVFPIIDLEGVLGPNPQAKRKQIVDQVRDSSSNWGFFQVVNHGFPQSLLDEMKAGVARFYEQDVELKKPFFERDDPTKKIVYNSNFDLYTAPFANWRDTTTFNMAPHPPEPHELPSCCRDILISYSSEMLKLGDLLLGLLSEALGLTPNHLKEMDCSNGLYVLCHYHPPCPQPELTLGSTKHQDDDFITVLLQDDIGGLQVLHQDQWVDVPPLPGSLVVNIGDLLQLVSNDKFRSVEHRAVVKSKGPRVSVASFFTHGFSQNPRMYGPIKELLSEDDPPKYREITIQDLTSYIYDNGLGGTSALHHLKL